MQKNKLLVLVAVLFLVIGGGMVAKKLVVSKPTGEVAGVTSDASVKTFNINGGSFYFKPNVINVNKGDKVKIVFTNDEGFHDFVIDEYNVKIGPIKGGETAEATFTADKSGTFEFYCSVGNHRARGQVGKITVE